jgi:intraflagellar transport protein 122
MEISPVWNDQIPEKDGVKLCVNDIAFSPGLTFVFADFLLEYLFILLLIDGSRIIAAVGNRVLLYRSSDGDLLESLRGKIVRLAVIDFQFFLLLFPFAGHKESVLSVSYSSDGSRFASGGADNVVVIWKNTGQGLLKYNHSAPIQRVKYNPSLLLLASCSEVDFGLWTPDQKQVTKEKVPSRIVSVSWSLDGTILALGMLNGMISIRNQQAEEILKFERKAPIWCLSFIPEPQGPQRSSASANSSAANAAAPSAGGNSLLDHTDNLAVCSWDKEYVLYK